jgi:hypothetical protein
MVHKNEGLSEYFKNQGLLKVLQTLKSKGFQALIAGGAVRDAIRGYKPHDFDIVTDASVEQIQKIFSYTIPVGIQFGVLIVCIEGQNFEVAQFRDEADYQDGRRPSLVKPGTRESDARRRDFTMNALFYDPISYELFDDVNGITDIQQKIIRAVGNPIVRFQEDHLRILRAMRFQIRTGFLIEPRTYQALIDLIPLSVQVSNERIISELKKCFESDHFLKFVNEPYWPMFFTSWLDLKLIRNQLDTHKEIEYWQRITQTSWILSLGFALYNLGASIPEIRNQLRKKIKSKQDWNMLNQFLRGLDQQTCSVHSLGEQLVMSTDSLVRLGMEYWVEQDSVLKQIWRDWEQLGQVPPPQVKAHDLIPLGIVPGSQLGEVLKKSYELQLLNGLKDTQSILDCLVNQGYIKKA